MLQNTQVFKVKSRDGRIWEVPEHNLDAAIARGAEVYEEPHNHQSLSGEENKVSTPTLSTNTMKKVQSRDGRIWEVPEDKVQIALSRGAKIISEDSNVPTNDSDGVGKFSARTAKSALSGGVGGVIDAATSLYNIPAALTNASNKINKDDTWEIDPISGTPVPKVPGEPAELPLIPSATEAIDKGIDEATGGYTRTPEQEKWFQEGVKFASSVASGGGLGSVAGKAGLKGTEKALNAVGSTKPSVITGAGVAGAATQKAHDMNMSPLGSAGVGIGAGLATGAAFKALNPKNIEKGFVSSIGFGKNNLNLDAIESAKNLNIDLPPASVTKGVAPAVASQSISKFPYFGDKLKEKIKTTSDQYQKAWEDMLDSVGAPKTDEFSENIKRSYDLMLRTVPEDAVIAPKHILESINYVEKKLKTIVYSDKTKKLFDIMKEFKDALKPQLPSGYEKFPPRIQEKIIASLSKEVNPINVHELIRQKIELNNIMNDKKIFDRTDKYSLQFLKKLQSGVRKNLEEYGKTNPTFFKMLKRTDEKFSKTSKREELDDLLAGKVFDPNTGEVSYNPLIKILSDRKKQKFLRNKLGEANYKKLKDFVNVAKSMESLKRNNPNPSGTASMTAAFGLLSSIAGSIYTGNPLVAGVPLSGISVATKLLTSKKFLNKATQFAKEPTEPLAKQLETIVKDSTGMTIQEIQKETREGQNS